MVCLNSYSFLRAALPLASCFRTALSNRSYFLTLGRSSSESESRELRGDRPDVFALIRSRCFRTKFRSFCRAFFTFPVGVAGGMAGADADRGVAGGIERARERGGGGVSTELRGVVAGERSCPVSSRRAGILVWAALLLFVKVLACWTRCVGRAAASVMLGQPSAVARRLISLTCARCAASRAPSLHLPGSLASNLL